MVKNSIIKLNITGNSKFKILAMRFEYILFYSSTAISINQTLLELRKLHIKFLYIANVTWIGRHTYHLKGASLVIFTNNITQINAIQLTGLHLYLLSAKKYFLNILNYQLPEIFLLCKFYTNNYFFIIQYLTWFYRTFILLLWYARCRILMQLLTLSKQK